MPASRLPRQLLRPRKMDPASCMIRKKGVGWRFRVAAQARSRVFHQFMTLDLNKQKILKILPSSINSRNLFRSVVLVPLVRALGARVENCATFVGGSQLLGVVACLRVAALFTWVVDDGVGLDLALVVFLHVGA